MWLSVLIKGVPCLTIVGCRAAVRVNPNIFEGLRWIFNCKTRCTLKANPGSYQRHHRELRFQNLLGESAFGT